MKLSNWDEWFRAIKTTVPAEHLAAELQRLVNMGLEIPADIAAEYAIRPLEQQAIDVSECDEARPRGLFCSLAVDIAKSDEGYREVLQRALATSGQPSTWSDLVYAHQHCQLMAVVMSWDNFPKELAERIQELPYFPPLIAEWNEQQKTSGVIAAMPTELAHILAFRDYEVARRRGHLGTIPSEAAHELAAEAGLGMFGPSLPGFGYEHGMPRPSETETEPGRKLVRFEQYPGVPVAIDAWAVNAIRPGSLTLDQITLTTIWLDGDVRFEVAEPFDEVVAKIEAAR